MARQTTYKRVSRLTSGTAAGAYRLVTQFELIGSGVDRARAGVSATIGLLRGRPETNEPHELPSLPAAKPLNIANGELENGIAEIAATFGGEHRPGAE
jgi:hypothetical protein